MSLNTVSEQLLAANGLKHQDLFAILGQLAERRLDYGDLYFQSSYHESRVLEDRIIKDGSYNIDQGVGVRAISGENRICLRRPNQPAGAGTECASGAHHRP